MEREILLSEQIDVAVGRFTFRVRLMSDGALGLDFSDEGFDGFTVSGELNPEAANRIVLAAAQLQLRQGRATSEDFVEGPDGLVSPIFQGVHADRLATCPAEMAVAQLWEAENLQASSLKGSPSIVSIWEPANSLLGRLLSRDPDHGIRPSPRDWMVASTVMQWLGTARGWLFLAQVQMVAARTDSKEE